VCPAPVPDLSPVHQRLVREILSAHLPADAEIWAFGSRTAGRARPYSDIDLAIDAGRPLTLNELARLGAAFSDSDLPYRVDLVDWRALDERFRRTIAPQRVFTLGRLALDETATHRLSRGGGAVNAFDAPATQMTARAAVTAMYPADGESRKPAVPQPQFQFCQ
jgi:predicted nucleotidyltransferase